MKKLLTTLFLFGALTVNAQTDSLQVYKDSVKYLSADIQFIEAVVDEKYKIVKSTQDKKIQFLIDELVNDFNKVDEAGARIGLKIESLLRIIYEIHTEGK